MAKRAQMPVPNTSKKKPKGLAQLLKSGTMAPAGQATDGSELASLQERVQELEAERNRLLKAATADAKQLGLKVDKRSVVLVTLDDMRERDWHSDTIRQSQVETLWALIAKDGLQTPLILERGMRCLSGETRRRALLFGRSTDAGVFDEWFPDGAVPCIISDLDWDTHQTECDVAMLSMQQQRTRDRGAVLHEKIRRIYSGIRKDSRFTWDAGAPPEGKISGREYLKQLFGCGRNTVYRALEGAVTEPANDATAQQRIFLGRSAKTVLKRLEDVQADYPRAETLRNELEKLRKWCDTKAK